jgi:adenylylsulfate kinase
VSGTVIWLTGLPSSGKSTLARRLAARLAAGGRPALVLDGDEVRDALVPPPGHDAAGRAAFYETLARLAAGVARQGQVAIVAATAHRRAFREAARALAPRFLEVWLDVPADACAARDAKGLWALARAGGAPELPGAGVGYEIPARPDVVARGGEDDRAIAEILARLG